MNPVRLGLSLRCALLLWTALCLQFTAANSEQHPHGHEWSSVECKGEPGYNMTCFFTDVLFMEGEFYLTVPINTTLPVFGPITMTSEGNWIFKKLHVLEFESKAHRTKALHLDNTTLDGKHASASVIRTLTLLQTCYLGNPAHMTYDCLYAGFVAMTRFFPPKTKLLFATTLDDYAYDNHASQYATEIIRAFWGLGHLTLTDLAAPKTRPILFKKLLIGSQNLGILGFYENMQLAHHDQFTMRHFRDRVYRTFDMEPPQPLSQDMSSNRHAVIFANKRYTSEEQHLLVGLTAPGKIENLTITYYNWGEPLETQLHLFAKTHIYISGPGTGLLFHFMLPDGSVVINIGAMQAPCNKDKAAIPYFMEMHVAATTWAYQSAFYYDSTIRHLGLAENEMIRLLALARDAVGRHQVFVAGPRDNLSPEGQLAYDICTGPEAAKCRPYFLARNYATHMVTDKLSSEDWWFGCRHYRWVEFAIYEACPFAENGYHLEFKNMTIRCTPLPRDLVRVYKATNKYRIATNV